MSAGSNVHHPPRDAIRRWARRARSWFRHPAATIVSHARYEAPPNPFADPHRAEKILDYLVYQGCLTSHGHVEPRRATIAQLHRVHPWSYLTSIDEPEQLDRIFGDRLLDLPGRQFIEQQRWTTGGTVRAAQLALRGRPGQTSLVVSLGGGHHHGFADGGFGFCAFNDVAVAIADLRAHGFEGRVLVIDLDLHQGDGTRRIFAEDASVTTLSIHDVSWDATEVVESVDVELGHGVDDATWRKAICDHVDLTFARVDPDLVFYIGGVDVAGDDPVGSWRISPETVLWRDQHVVELIGETPTVWVLGGGYGQDAWRLTARSLAWLLSGYDAPIASRTERFVRRFRGIARRLRPDDLSLESNQDIDLSDIFDDLRRPPSPSRLLGFYTRYGVEAALERYGVLPHIRERIGEVPVAVELELDHPTGQLVRLVTDDGQRDVLIELVVDERQDTALPDAGAPLRLLWLEWLLAQNPRATGEPSLPGQSHPGLGSLKKIIGMLLMSCERLGFDGLAFNPAHYHIAALGRAVGAVFLDPSLHGRFLALTGALSGVPLDQASHLVDSGQVIDCETGEPAAWVSERMVVPSAPRLAAQIESPAWSDAVQAAAAAHRFERPGDDRRQRNAERASQDDP